MGKEGGMKQWVDIKEEMPKKRERVLLYTKYSCDSPHIEIGWYTGLKTTYRMWQYEEDEATGQNRGTMPDYWMPLPEEP